MTLKDLLDKVKTYNEKADLDLIKKAFYFAQQAHGDQMRINGEEWMQHPLKTADRLANYELGDKLIAAALLHDVVEDTDKELKDIKKSFGREIANLVQGVTKVTAVKYQGEEKHLAKLQNLFIMIADDLRVILIKLADRLHNLETLEALPRKKRKEIAEESLQVFAPIADRLSLGEWRGEIEDLSFQYAHPQEYRWVKKTAEERTKQKKARLKKIQKTISKKLKKLGIQVKDIHLRRKHYFSLYRKLLNYNSNIDRIYDLQVIRIIVENEQDCYTALGIIHDLWQPLKGKIKDYLAQPKSNGYRSLQTTVLTKPDSVEFQIKTERLHRLAEEGIAFLYAKRQRRQLSRLPIIKEISQIKKQFKNKDKYLDILKQDVFQRQIVVFTPHGDIITLPEQATPIDFAYRVHTDIGNKCQQAKINGKTLPLDTTLKSGDIVEIITDPRRKKPKKKWLQTAKTEYARYQIHRELKK